jgi:hypothetical protein
MPRRALQRKREREPGKKKYMYFPDCLSNSFPGEYYIFKKKIHKKASTKSNAIPTLPLKVVSACTGRVKASPTSSVWVGTAERQSLYVCRF